MNTTNNASTDFVGILSISASAVGRATLVATAGILVSRLPRDAPILTDKSKQGLGRLLIRLLVPCLAFHALASSITPDNLPRLWPIIIWCGINIALALACSLAISRLLKLNGTYLRAFSVAGAFGNNVGLPLLLLDSLCTRPALQAEYGAECKVISYGYVMLYGMPWRLFMFGVALPWMKRGGSSEVVPDEEEQYREMEAVQAASPADDSCASPQPFEGTPEGQGGQPAPSQMVQVLKDLFLEPNVIVSFLGLVVGLLPPVKRVVIDSEILGGTLETMGECVVGLSTIMLGAALWPASMSSPKDLFTGVKLSHIVALCSLRFLLVPGVGFGLAVLAMKYLSLPGDKLLWLVVLVQFAVPSAQMVVVSLSAIGRHELASRLAPLYAIQYLVSAVALTSWTALALVISGA